jgi:hypothetical protein
VQKEKPKGYAEVKDHGGERKTFGTGAVREVPQGKGRFDLIPPYPLVRLAQHYENGAIKYADRNWEKGLPLGRTLDSAFRHLVQFMANDRSEDHLAAVLWNVFAYVHTEDKIKEGKLPAELFDVPWDYSVPEEPKS